MNRAQIERAEQAAAHLDHRKRLLHDMRSREEKLELEMQEIEHQRALVRRRQYLMQTYKFEQRRLEATEWLIREGVIEAEPGWLAYEAPVVRESIEEFTRQQTRLAQTLI